MYSGTVEEREEKRKQIFEELRAFLTYKMSYMQYLETFGKKNNLLYFFDAQRLQLLYATFMLMLWKDTYMTKENASAMKRELSEELLDTYVDEIAKQDRNGKWKIGDLSFEDSYEVIDVVKKKLTHGDYTVDGIDVIINSDKENGRIPIDKLVHFTNLLGTRWEETRKKGENIHNLIAIHSDYEDSRITTFADFEKALSNMEYIEIIDKPISGFERNEQYHDVLVDFLQDLKDKTNSTEQDAMSEVLRDYYKLFEEVGISIDIKSTPALMLENIGGVVNAFKSNKTFFKEKDLNEQLQYIAYVVYEKNSPIAFKKNLTEGVLINQEFLTKLCIDETTPIEELLEIKNNKASLPQQVKYDKALLTAQLVDFYATYIYGLDEIYTANEQDHIDKIIEEKMLDFSKLDLRSIKYETMTIGKDFNFFNDQINSNRSIAKKAKENKEKQLEDCKKLKFYITATTNEVSRQKMTKALHEKEDYIIEDDNIYKKMTKKIKLEEKFLNNNYEDYKTNRSIIEHIRNSFSHGHVYLNYAAGKGRFEDATYIFEDKENDVTTFKAELTSGQFKSLITGKNKDYMIDYLDTNNKMYRQDLIRMNNELYANNQENTQYPGKTFKL